MHLLCCQLHFTNSPHHTIWFVFSYRQLHFKGGILKEVRFAEKCYKFSHFLNSSSSRCENIECDSMLCSGQILNKKCLPMVLFNDFCFRGLQNLMKSFLGKIFGSKLFFHCFRQSLFAIYSQNSLEFSSLNMIWKFQLLNNAFQKVCPLIYLVG